MKVLGIDPGISGALVAVEGVRVIAHDWMPIRPGPAGRKKVDAQALFDIVHAINRSVGGLDRVVLENPSAMPKQGVSSSFAFGRSVGIAEGVIVSLGVPWELVSPSHWKRRMSVPADKKAARARASDVMPADRHLWARASDDGVAEAALLAYWAQGELVLDRLTTGMVMDLFGELGNG